MTTRTPKNGNWLTTVYWLGAEVYIITGAAMLGLGAIRMAGSVHLGI